MGSRLRENPEKLFEVFMEVAKPNGEIQAPFVLQKYPEDYSDEEVLKSSPKFAYPCEIDCGTVDHFTFVFTDIDGKFKFGFCRHTPGAQTTLCIVSCLPWFEIFYKMLNTIAEILNRAQLNCVVPLLEGVYKADIPSPNIPVTIVFQQEMFSFKAPDVNQLPSIPASRNLTEYYNAIDTHNMMVIFAHMLNERRIIVTSKKLSRLTSCIHAAQALLYPMAWQHLFIPLLPAHGNLIEYVSAPMPYLIGVHSSLLPTVLKMEIGDAVLVDADNNTVQTEHTDFNDLPEDVASYLKKCLRPDKVKSSMMSSGDAISKAFLQALVRLIGGYRDALRFRTGEPITFDRDLFVMSRNSSMQGYLENMLQLQIFQQFINNRLDLLNTGYGFSDLFEQQSLLYADKLNTQSRYKEWQNQMKKQGKKLQKGGKDMWSDIKEKVKSHSKKAYSDIRARLNEMNERGSGSTRSSPKIEHTTTASSTTSKEIIRNRPSTMTTTDITTRDRIIRNISSPTTPNRPTTTVGNKLERKIPYVEIESTNEAYISKESQSSTSRVISSQETSVTINKPPPRPPKPKPRTTIKQEIDPSPLISFNDNSPPSDNTPVTFGSDSQQNDLIFSVTSPNKQSPQISSLNRSGAFRQSDRSPKIQSYRANLYANQDLMKMDSETDPAKLFDPLANRDVKLPNVDLCCDSSDLLGDFLSDDLVPKTGGRTNVDPVDTFDLLATPPALRQSNLLDNSLQSSSSLGSTKSFEDLFASSTLDSESTSKKSSSPFATWTTFE